jgi:hypothetical protein
MCWTSKAQQYAAGLQLCSKEVTVNAFFISELTISSQPCVRSPLSRFLNAAMMPAGASSAGKCRCTMQEDHAPQTYLQMDTDIYKSKTSICFLTVVELSDSCNNASRRQQRSKVQLDLHSRHNKVRNPLLTVVQLSECRNDASRRQQRSKVQVGDVGGPGWGLVLAHTGDNGHKARSVGWVEQSETTACKNKKR